MRRVMFWICVHTCPQVYGICSKAALVSSAAPRMAFLTTSAVSAPSLAISRICPVVTPRESAMVCAIIGVCSSTLLSSSPRSAPEDRPCVSWSMAACALAVDAPDIAICFCSCSAKAMISLVLPNASPASVPSLATVSAMSVYAPRDRMAAA